MMKRTEAPAPTSPTENFPDATTRGAPPGESAAPLALVMAGGTGGHIFPALAVAEALRARGWRILWLGAAGRMEEHLVPAQGFTLVSLPVQGVRGRGVLGALHALRLQGQAVCTVRALLRREQPHLVLGFGGYTTVAGGLAARSMKIPLLIHEQNAVAGLSNRLLARLADRVLEAFPNSFPAARQARTVGNPVRGEIARLPAPAQRFAGRHGPLRWLVLGGSLGAATLNRVVPEALARIAPEWRPQIIHQSGAQHLPALEARYRALGVVADCRAFIDGMAAVYAEVDGILCRAGALTLAEIAVVGLGAILIPFPHAVDDHQTRNATHFVANGAAQLIPETRLDAAQLAQILEKMDRAELLQMACAARALAFPRATEDVAECALALTVAAQPHRHDENMKRA